MLRSSLEEEEQKLFINRKRKSSIGSEDEYNSQNNQMRRHEEPAEESDDSEDEDEDSDEEEIEEKDDTITNFLQSSRVETNLDNVSHFYDNLHNSLHVPNGSRIDGQNHVPLNSYVDPIQQHNDLELYSDMNGDNGSEDWTQSILNNTSTNRRIPWNHRFEEGEAAVAVESILNDDEDEPDMSVDLSGIEGLDDTLDDDNEEDDDDDDDDDEDDDEDDDVNGYAMAGDGHQHQQHVDVQMQCAIKSILDMPSVASHPSHNNSYAFHSHNSHPSLHPHMNDFRNMDYSHIPNIHDQRRDILRSYGGQHPTGVNDPILDEAVKSILS